MAPAKVNFKIFQGTTFRQVYRWETDTKYYANIQSITKSGPCILTTSAAHSIPAGWRIKITNVGGMKEINSTGDDDYHFVNDVTASTLTVNSINSTGYSNYTSGGTIEYYAPYPLQYYTARMQIRANVNSDTIILALNSNAGGGIVLNTANSTITLTITAQQTEQFNFTSAVYGMELTDTSGVVTPFITGNIIVVKDVIR